MDAPAVEGKLPGGPSRGAMSHGATSGARIRRGPRDRTSCSRATPVLSWGPPERHDQGGRRLRHVVRVRWWIPTWRPGRSSSPAGLLEVADVPDVLAVGGGIAGLAAAWRLRTGRC